MKKLRVALIGTSWKPIPPDGYGGIENVVYDLITGSRGLDISWSLFTVGETVDLGKLPSEVDVRWFFEKGMYPEIGNEATKVWIEANHAMAAWEHVSRENFDLIHDHSGIGFGMIAGSVTRRPPILMTLHGPLDIPLIQHYYRFLEKRREIYFNSISYAQRTAIPDLTYVGNVYNGVNLEHVPFERQKDNYLLILGRITPDKGQREAIEVARKLGINLVIAGSVEQTPRSITYWREAVECELDENLDGAPEKIAALRMGLANGRGKIFYVGEADTPQKFELFKRAHATLMPISWEEPFGLVMIESLATGTPVVGFNRGSVPEIIAHGENGYIVKDTDEMIRAIGSLSRILPETCRESVEKRFSNNVMANAYHRVYREILSPREP